MKILAIDSTETTVAAAVAEGRELTASVTVNGRLNHSETLLPAIEEIMRGVGLDYGDIDIFACSEGPGSFTGVRIGAATVKGLAFGRGKPCVGVSALHAMAYNFIGFSGIVCPVMDARRSQLYNAVFRINGREIIRLSPDRVITAAELAAELSGYPGEPVYFCGGGDGYISAAAGMISQGKPAGTTGMSRSLRSLCGIRMLFPSLSAHLTGMKVPRAGISPTFRSHPLTFAPHRRRETGTGYNLNGDE
ncbi:tRNA threonylcarbamoyl adenosine modification protein YeaZ [Candidatus Colimorpha enterica]|uniref:tRNA threonylcarbamoyl adenosine modification protein YeaZ n=1 Tax=Candidatus Colimorpha enterica TaxID=3083063 RepID=R6TV81_9BACT|nr:tRNA threonylcarbamoyl adenosine modification protein YeaZ [Candidatus Colimorpha enterica]